jgi:DNA-binding response OmpR family regulator
MAVRILIVDDDETFCQLLAEIFESRGMQVTWTTDGLAGYERSLYESYDVFILDQRMPLVLGTELVEDLKKDNPEAKIILISAFADRALQKLSHTLGIPLLSKPFSAQELLQAVEGIVGSAKLEGN